MYRFTFWNLITFNNHRENIKSIINTIHYYILCKPLILKRDISGVFMTQSKCWSPGLLIVSTESLMLPDYKSRGILSFALAAKVFCTFLCLQFLALWFTLKNFTASFNLNFQLNNAINRKIEESRPPPKFHST